MGISGKPAAACSQPARGEGAQNKMTAEPEAKRELMAGAATHVCFLSPSLSKKVEV